MDRHVFAKDLENFINSGLVDRERNVSVRCVPTEETIKLIEWWNSSDLSITEDKTPKQKESS